jgi:hypothetical protein
LPPEASGLEAIKEDAAMYIGGGLLTLILIIILLIWIF